jgi:hypothetical protein
LTNRRGIFIAVLVPSIALVAACGGESDSGAGGGATAGAGAGASTAALPCDVDAVLAASCRQCHAATPLYGAPMPLVTYADLHAPAVTDPSMDVYQLVEQRIHDDAKPMPQPPYPRLDAADLSTLDAWTGAGAPAGHDASCSGSGGGAGGAGGGGPVLGCTPDIHVAPASDWTMPADETDVYVCYGFDVAAGARKDVVGFVPRIDNKAIVHHILLYQSDTAESPTPTPCDGGLTVQGRKLIYGWAPGGTPFELPPEAGMPMDVTTHYYAQVHYNNIAGLTGETDHSGFDLCSTTEARANEADMIAFGTVRIDLPPYATTSDDCTYTWPASAGTVKAIAAFPHMHKLGTSIWTKQDPGGDAVDLGTNSPWDFNNQPFLPIQATIAPGDTIETKCTWTNSTPSTVRFGEYTEDEMCFSFTMYYPRSAAFDTWIQPSLASQCH